MAKEKVILAYSGGLDTSIIIPWLKENYDYDVIAVAGDVGQGEELEPLNEKAINTGASKLYIEDLREDYVTNYIFPTLRAGAVYEGKYLLGTSHARPCIAKRLVEIAHKEGASAIAHGATGKGNDQVRFELTIMALDPKLKIIAPWRMWDIKSREEEIDYANARGIPVPVTKEHNYSMDRNIWHLSHEGSDLEDPWNMHKEDMYMICTPPSKAPDAFECVEIEFDKGTPVAVNGEKLPPVKLVEVLNDLGAKHGVGIADLVENRLVGMKCRGVYETPGGTILYEALRQLERLTLDRQLLHYKEMLAIRYAELVYDGCWFTPLKDSIDAFVNTAMETCSGVSRVKLFKGNCSPAGVKSPYSLYDQELVTFEEDQVYNQYDAEGFIRLFGLPLKVRSMMLAKNGK